MEIVDIKSGTVFDSRGNPTVETEVFLKSGSIGRAIVPSGASVGALEAVELRDNDKSRYHGQGVDNAIHNVNSIIRDELINQKIDTQKDLDNILIELDGTPNKKNLGANAILSVSLAFAKARANELKIPLYQSFSINTKYSMPIPMINIINGGAHSNNSLDIQEFMIVPEKNDNFLEMLRKSTEVFQALKQILISRGFSTNVGDEGGFAPDLRNNTEYDMCDISKNALFTIQDSIKKAGYEPGKDFNLALDVAATELFNKRSGAYEITEFAKKEDKESAIKNFNSKELVGYYNKIIQEHPIISIEDGMAENDHTGWKLLTETLGNKTMLVGDDLFVTNHNELNNGIKNNLANAILIKPNQIGTLTETLETIKLAQKNNYKVVISHRSGETEDTTIAHIAVGTGAEYIKTGAICRSERVAKYNELLRIYNYDFHSMSNV